MKKGEGKRKKKLFEYIFLNIRDRCSGGRVEVEGHIMEDESPVSSPNGKHAVCYDHSQLDGGKSGVWWVTSAQKVDNRRHSGICVAESVPNKMPGAFLHRTEGDKMWKSFVVGIADAT